mmetsp:Transcript_45374/g.108260  ORF Transcript_45374/g.108260 Transcript_45374/m.108260 type:complete len:347 (-) Transcript_45374:191-1231(-)
MSAAFCANTRLMLSTTPPSTPTSLPFLSRTAPSTFSPSRSILSASATLSARAADSSCLFASCILPNACCCSRSSSSMAASYSWAVASACCFIAAASEAASAAAASRLATRAARASRSAPRVSFATARAFSFAASTCPRRRRWSAEASARRDRHSFSASCIPPCAPSLACSSDLASSVTSWRSSPTLSSLAARSASRRAFAFSLASTSRWVTWAEALSAAISSSARRTAPPASSRARRTASSAACRPCATSRADPAAASLASARPRREASSSNESSFPRRSALSTSLRSSPTWTSRRSSSRSPTCSSSVRRRISPERRLPSCSADTLASCPRACSSSQCSFSFHSRS